MLSPPDNRDGLTLAECLVALVLLAVGIMGATGVVAAAWRVERAGDDAALAARRLVSVADSLAGVGSCAAIRAGSATWDRVTVAWAVALRAGHADVKLTVVIPTPAGTRSDTAPIRVPCSAAA
jgi:prepilin-type N-terminal cleavage/methylation domain-containing protein